MVSNTKKLLCIVFIWLILPFASVLHNPMQDVAAASEPTVTILDVTSDDTYRITVTVELSLTDYNYDYYINELRLYLNQSSKTINETNNFNSYNSSKTLNRPDEAVFETEILSPVLSDGSHEDSAYYNITIVAITETDVKSELAEWSGGYYFIDTELPSITFISPSVAYEEIWGIYTVEVNVTDLSNISMVSFYVDNSIRKKITDPTPGQVAFTWDWLCANHTRGDHFIKVRARDASDALNKKDLSFSVTIVGPELDYVEGPAEDYTIVSRPPNTIDENETLIISTLVEDANYDINTTILRYSLDDGPFQEIIFNNPLADNYYNALISEGNFTVGTKINFEIYVNNSVGQYHLFRNETLQPWELYAQYPDHIPPEGEIFYTRNITLGDPVSVEANITEQSPVTNCEIHYQITSEGEWIETDMTLIDSSFNSSDWFYYQYNF
ncbi:MAG: hypothetical protein U9O98_02145, partial [Asgard group archaeon]|nr:hypothetical protein [Asgard group archaeon]